MQTLVQRKNDNGEQSLDVRFGTPCSTVESRSDAEGGEDASQLSMVSRKAPDAEWRAARIDSRALDCNSISLKANRHADNSQTRDSVE